MEEDASVMSVDLGTETQRSTSQTPEGWVGGTGVLPLAVFQNATSNTGCKGQFLPRAGHAYPQAAAGAETPLHKHVGGR